MPDHGVVICAWYNRTVWPKEIPVPQDQHVPMTRDYFEALVLGHYVPTHEYENVYGEHWFGGAEYFCDAIWVRLQAGILTSDDIFGTDEHPIHDRSMCVGDIITCDRIVRFDPLEISHVGAWSALMDGWEPCPTFLERFRI